MQGLIGSLIWLWVSIERTAEELDAERAVSGHTAAVRGVSARLDRWEKRVQEDAAERPFRTRLARRLRTQVREAQRIRNGICHGLSGIEVANSERPGRLYWRVGGAEQSRTWEEMQGHFAWLSKVPGALLILNRVEVSRFSRLDDTIENREWWAAEYGVDLDA